MARHEKTRNGEGETGGVFLKVYDGFWTSGLAGRLGPDLVCTFLALASFMNKDFECFPSQSELGKRLGVSRATVNRRIQALLDFRWNEKPILESTRRFNGSNVYQISNWAQVAIFDAKLSPIEPDMTFVKKRTNSEILERARMAKRARRSGNATPSKTDHEKRYGEVF